MMSDSEVPDNPKPEPAFENVNPQSIEGLFLVALEKKTPAERARFLDKMCGDNVDQRRRVEALLMAYDDAGSFLENSPVGSDEPQPISLDFLTPSANPDLLGTLGEYEIYEVIGQGGMGIVFRALDPKLNRIVAIKVMSPHLAINANARKRFLREAQAAAAISHPHIVTIHAVDENKLPYLVMEYVAGQSLQEKLEKTGSLQVTEILRIGQQIAEGLAAAHKQGLIHRDIKPANILLENGVERVKITDFGLARAVDDVAITRTGEISGTPQYMSPEQAKGERVDQRSDLFSLGAVLYAMCTGRSPFRASNLAAVVRRVCDDVPRPIEEVNEAIPTWLCEIIDCLLEKDPDNRIQKASEVADLLEAHLGIAQQPISELHASYRSRQSVTEKNSTKSKQLAGYWGDLLAVWIGGLMLLVPFVLWGIGAAGGGHFATSVEEMVLYSLLFFEPLGLLVMIYGLQKIVQPESTVSKILDGLFLLICFLSGPLGLLLYVARYMKKRNARSPVDTKQSITNSSLNDRIVEEQANSNKRVIIGVTIGIGLLLLLWLLNSAWGQIKEWQRYWFVVWGVICVATMGPFIVMKFFREALKNPWKAIGWLVLSVPLFFLGLFAVFILLPMFANASTEVISIDYDTDFPVTRISVGASETFHVVRKSHHVHSRPFILKMNPGKHTLQITFKADNQFHKFTRNVQKESGEKLKINLTEEIQHIVQDLQEAKERKMNYGAILLSGQLPGLRVGIFPVDSSKVRPEDGVFGFADRFYSLETVSHEVPAGAYEIKVSSSNAGWVIDHSNPQYTGTMIEIKPGEIFNVEVSRDYRKLVENHPDWSQNTLFQFVWPFVSQSGNYSRNNLRVTLSAQQAAVVQQLLIAFADGKPEVTEAELLAIATRDSKSEKSQSLSKLFNHGKHPAWNTLVVPGKTKGTWRLIEPINSHPRKKKMNPGDPFEGQNPFSLHPSPEGEVEAKKPRLESLNPFGPNVPGS